MKLFYLSLIVLFSSAAFPLEASARDRFRLTFVSVRTLSNFCRNPEYYKKNFEFCDREMNVLQRAMENNIRSRSVRAFDVQRFKEKLGIAQPAGVVTQPQPQSMTGKDLCESGRIYC